MVSSVSFACFQRLGCCSSETTYKSKHWNCEKLKGSDLMVLEPGARLGGELEAGVLRQVRECGVGQAYLLLQRVAGPKDPG